VVVDNVPPAGETGGTTAAPAAPRSAEEMKKITDIVSAAVGIDTKRGDVLIVQNVPFDGKAVPGEVTGTSWLDRDMLLRGLRYLSLPLAVLLLAFLVIRP